MGRINWSEKRNVKDSKEYSLSLELDPVMRLETANSTQQESNWILENQRTIWEPESGSRLH